MTTNFQPAKFFERGGLVVNFGFRTRFLTNVKSRSKGSHFSLVPNDPYTLGAAFQVSKTLPFLTKDGFVWKDGVARTKLRKHTRCAKAVVLM